MFPHLFVTNKITTNQTTKKTSKVYLYIYSIDQYNLGSYPWSYQK